MLDFIPSFRGKIIRWTQTFKSGREVIEVQSAQTPKEMLNFYQKQLQTLNVEIRDLNETITDFDSQIDLLKEQSEQLSVLLREATKAGDEIKELKAYVPPQKGDLNLLIRESTIKEIIII